MKELVKTIVVYVAMASALLLPGISMAQIGGMMGGDDPLSQQHYGASPRGLMNRGINGEYEVMTGNQPFGIDPEEVFVPLGNGTLVLFSLGVGYAMARLRKSKTNHNDKNEE